jgi:DNA-binding NarL/FixJ family response regulator
MDEPRRILLVSPDLLATSRVATLARECQATVETLRSLDQQPAGSFDLVLVDLDANRGDPAVILARTRAVLETVPPRPGGPPKIVAFGPHVHRQRLDDAVAAGADEAVSRGELLGSFPALLRRWIG